MISRILIILAVLFGCGFVYWFWREIVQIRALKKANDVKEKLDKFLERNDLWHPETQRLLEKAIRAQEHYLTVWKLSHNNKELEMLKAWRKPGTKRNKLSHLRVLK